MYAMALQNSLEYPDFDDRCAGQRTARDCGDPKHWLRGELHVHYEARFPYVAGARFEAARACDWKLCSQECVSAPVPDDSTTKSSHYLLLCLILLCLLPAVKLFEHLVENYLLAPAPEFGWCQSLRLGRKDSVGDASDRLPRRHVRGRGSVVMENRDLRKGISKRLRAELRDDEAARPGAGRDDGRVGAPRPRTTTPGGPRPRTSGDVDDRSSTIRPAPTSSRGVVIDFNGVESTIHHFVAPGPRFADSDDDEGHAVDDEDPRGPLESRRAALTSAIARLGDSGAARRREPRPPAVAGRGARAVGAAAAGAARTVTHLLARAASEAPARGLRTLGSSKALGDAPLEACHAPAALECHHFAKQLAPLVLRAIEARRAQLRRHGAVLRKKGCPRATHAASFCDHLERKMLGYWHYELDERQWLLSIAAKAEHQLRRAERWERELADVEAGGGSPRDERFGGELEAPEEPPTPRAYALAWALAILINAYFAYFLVAMGSGLGRRESKLWLFDCGFSLALYFLIIKPGVIAIFFVLIPATINTLAGGNADVADGAIEDVVDDQRIAVWKSNTGVGRPDQTFEIL
ncbi:hypothetical protein JL720_15517 [Aureococcus anophagefferens]|nr:hypothetical protein JL720_15517 [Aureococcus anophagefferens]